MKVHKILIIAVLMLPVLTQAEIGFGSFQSSEGTSIMSGDTAVFRVYFFNLDQEKVEIEIFPDKVPKDWEVSVDSNSFVLEPQNLEKTPIKGYQYLALDDGYVRVKPVEIKVATPWKVNTGDYQITVRAHGTSIKETEEDLGTFQNSYVIPSQKVSQEREFKFNIKITGLENLESELSGDGGKGDESDMYFGDTDQKENISEVEKVIKNETLESSQETSPTGFFVLSPSHIILILLLFGLVFYFFKRKF